MSDNPISVDQAISVDQVCDVSQPTLGANLTHVHNRPNILRAVFERVVTDPLRRRKAAQRFQRELAARDERLLLDIGLIREQSVTRDITGVVGSRNPHGLHMIGRRPPELYWRLK